MEKPENVIALIIIVFIVLACIAIEAICWDYTVSRWLVYLGEPDRFTFWHGVLCCFVPVIGQLGIGAAIVTFIAMDIFL